MKVELTTFLYNKKMVEDLGLKLEVMPCKCVVETGCIESVRELIEDGETEPSQNSCIIRLKSGDTYPIRLSYDAMLKLWLNGEQLHSNIIL
mgnify:CR=1 FL=1